MYYLGDDGTVYLRLLVNAIPVSLGSVLIVYLYLKCVSDRNMKRNVSRHTLSPISFKSVSIPKR